MAQGSIICTSTDLMVNPDASWRTYYNGGITNESVAAGDKLGGWSVRSPAYPILASAFDATSDARIKKEIVPLKEDQETFMKLNPVSYKYRDPAEGNRTVSGFIGQEIIKVLPTTVKKSKQVIPNILQLCAVADDLVTIACKSPDPKATTLKCVAKDGKTLMLDVKTVTGGSIVLAKPLEASDLDAQKIYVWGTEVSDFHTVDYVQIIPELVKQVQELTKKVAALSSAPGGEPTKPLDPETVKKQKKYQDSLDKFLKDRKEWLKNPDPLKEPRLPGE